MQTMQMRVSRVLRQHDRTLLYGYDCPSFHVIAPKEHAVRIGDVVTYEPHGMDFGFLVKVLAQRVN